MDDIQERLLSHRYYNTKVEYASVVVDYLIHTLGRDSETLRKLASVLDLGGAHMTECLPFDAQPIIINGKKHPPHVAVVRTFRWWQASKLFSWVTCTVGPESVCINPFHYKKRTRFQDMQNGDGEIVDSSAIFLCNGSIASQPIPMDASSQSVQGDPVFHSLPQSCDSHISLPTAKQQGLKCWMPGCDVDLKESVVDEENPRHYFRFPPRDSPLFQQWVAVGGHTAVEPLEGARICHLHFSALDLVWSTRAGARSGPPRCTLSEGAVPVPQVFSWMYDSEVLPEASQPSVRLSVRNVAVRQMSKTDDSMHVDLCSSKEDCNVAIKKEPFSCSVCQDVGDEPCWTHMRHVQDTHVLPLSLTSLPKILEFDKENAGVVTKSMILPQTMFGPFVAPLSHKQSQFVSGNEENFLQLDSDHQCNWMKHIRFAIKPEDQNLSVCLRESDVYFIATKLIPPGMELKAGYSEKYSWTLQNARKRRKLCDIALHCDLVDNTQNVCETFFSENGQNPGKTVNSCTPEVEDNGLSVLSTVDRPDSVPTISSRIYCPKPFKQPTLTNTFKYRCPKCELNFRSEALLNLHVLDHQDYVQEHVSMQCVGCEYVGQNFADLIQHVGQHGLTSNEMVRRYKMRTCPVCGGNAVHPREHIQMSHPDVFRDMASTWTLQCQTCKEKFPTEKGLHLHDKSVHQKRTNRDCRICQKVFASWIELRDHVQCHRGAEGFTCDECGKTFDAYAKLIRHLQQKHCPEVTGKFIGKDASFLKLVQEFLEQQTEKGILYNRSKQPQRKYKCGVCAVVFPGRNVRHQHWLSHQSPEERSSIDDLQCAMCGYDGEDFDDLMQHVLTHAISPSSEPLKKPDSKPRKRRRLGPVQRMVCIFCKERFQKRAAYHAHLPTHCGADGCYQCPECERKYPLLTKLRVHIDSTHRNIYPVTCKECGKVCGSPRKLRSHMWVHSNNYRYSCDHCGKKFKQLAETRNHIDEVHLGIKKKKTNKRKGKAYEPAKYNDCPYKCETCLCGYIERGRWVQHVRNKHPEIDITTLPP